MPESLDGNEYPYQHAKEKNCEETDLYEQEDGVAIIGSLDRLIFNLAHSIHLVGVTLPFCPRALRAKIDGRQSVPITILHVDHFLDSSCC